MKPIKVYPNLKGYLVAQRRAGVRQKDFAARVGISNGYLSDLKNGHVRPSLRLAVKLATEARIPLESFLSQEG